MPKRTRPTVTFSNANKRRKTRRVARRYRRPAPIARGPFPAERVVKLKYCNTGYLSNAPSGALASKQFKANSVFAPEVSTKQPYGYDQWAALYNHYVVLGSQIRIYAAPTPGTDNQQAPMAVGIMLTDEATFPYTDYTTAIEHNRSSFTMFQQNKGQKMSLVKNYSAKKFYNIKDVKDNVTRIGGTTGADVSEGAYFILWQQPIDSTSATVSRYVVVINYIVMFSEPKDVPGS